MSVLKQDNLMWIVSYSRGALILVSIFIFALEGK